MPNRPLDALESQVGDTHETVRDFEVEAGKVAEFARAIQDPADCYLDALATDSRGTDVTLAPPTYTRVSYFPRYRPEGIDEEFGFDLGFDREYVLHGEQRYRYHRPLRVGDRLRGETTLEDVFQRSGRSGGSMTFAVFRTDFYDASDSLVVEAWNTRIETDGPPGGADDETQAGSIELSGKDNAQSDSLNPGDAQSAVETPELERRDFVRYAGASGDFNPIHFDEPYATGAGHPSVFGQGMFSAGVASGFVRRWVGIDALTEFRTRFTARVFPGDRLQVRGIVTGTESDPAGRAITIDFEVVTTEKDRCVVEGDATAVVEE